MSQPQTAHNLLIATVGGRPEPLVASIAHWRPDRVLFVPSCGTVGQIADIRNLMGKKDYDLAEGAYDTVPLSDPQDFLQCVREMRAELESRVLQWRGRGEGYDCIVDFTGGTKCMSAALSLVARPWPNSRFSYVGGVERDRNNMGVVVSGSEQVVHAANPWDALGYQAVEDAVAAFDRHAIGEGAQLLRDALKRISDNGSRKSELNVLATFMDAYDLWSRSEYGKAFERFGQCESRLNDLAAALHPTPKSRLKDHIDEARTRLEGLKRGFDHPTRALLEDLISDAKRRQREGRHVDAVARLYRAVEATAQLRLWEKYEIRTSSVPLKKLPQPMRERLKAQAEDGTLKLALQESFELLRRWQDPLGERFVELGWHSRGSPLIRRNESIAGHGFAPVSPETSVQLWEGALSLAELADKDVFQFPQLGRQPDAALQRGRGDNAPEFRGR